MTLRAFGFCPLHICAKTAPLILASGNWLKMIGTNTTTVPTEMVELKSCRDRAD